MGDKDLAIGYWAGAVVAMIGVAAGLARDNTLSTYRVPTSIKKRVAVVAKRHGWSMGETSYFCTVIGLDAVEKADKESAV
jgi:hypothetical protein